MRYVGRILGLLVFHHQAELGMGRTAKILGAQAIMK